jgi:lysozyme
MDYGKSGLQLTKQFESHRLVAYQDSKGVWTIGFGHTREVFAGMTCSPIQADTWLMEDVKSVADTVNRLVRVALSQSQFDALVDFVFNVGVGHFEKSTLLRKLNARDYRGAADEFLKWDKCAGVELAGTKRKCSSH